MTSIPGLNGIDERIKYTIEKGGDEVWASYPGYSPLGTSAFENKVIINHYEIIVVEGKTFKVKYTPRNVTHPFKIYPLLIESFCIPL